MTCHYPMRAFFSTIVRQLLAYKHINIISDMIAGLLLTLLGGLYA